MPYGEKDPPRKETDDPTMKLLETKDIEIARLRRENMKLKAEIDNLKTENEERCIEITDGQEQRIADLKHTHQEDIRSLEEEYAMERKLLKRQIIDAGRKTDELEDTIHKRYAEKLQLQAEIKNLNAEAEESRIEISDAQELKTADLEYSHQEHIRSLTEDHTAERTHLRKQLLDARLRVDELEDARMAELAKIDAQKGEVLRREESLNSRLSCTLDRLAASCIEVEEYQVKNDESQSTIAELRSNIEAVLQSKEELKTLHDKLQSELKQARIPLNALELVYEKKLTNAKANFSKRLALLEKLMTEKMTDTIANKDAQINSLNQNYISQDNEINNLKCKIDTYTRGFAVITPKLSSIKIEMDNKLDRCKKEAALTLSRAQDCHDKQVSQLNRDLAHSANEYTRMKEEHAQVIQSAKCETEMIRECLKQKTIDLKTLQLQEIRNAEQINNLGIMIKKLLGATI